MGQNYLKHIDDEIDNRYTPALLKYREGFEYLPDLRMRAPNGTSLLVKGNKIHVLSPDLLKVPEYTIDFGNQSLLEWEVFKDGESVRVFSDVVIRLPEPFSSENEQYEKLRVPEETFRGLTAYVAKSFWNLYYSENKHVKEEMYAE